MPRGSHHDETGILYQENGELVIVCDNTQRWRVEGSFLMERKARKLLGKRVRIEATRVDFDVLAIKKLTSI